MPLKKPQRNRNPLSEASEPSWRAFEAAVRREFRDVVKIAVGALVLTGAVLTFDRLAGAEASLLYGVVLGLKVAAAVAMIWLLGLLRPRRPGTAAGRYRHPPRS